MHVAVHFWSQLIAPPLALLGRRSLNRVSHRRVRRLRNAIGSGPGGTLPRTTAAPMSEGATRHIATGEGANPLG